MKVQTGKNMQPPILYAECPGGGGHTWLCLNPRWHSETSRFGRGSGSEAGQKWCPEHEAEKKALVASKLSKLAQERYKDYAQLPMPPTRMCTNPNPTTHKPRAVLPSGSFYRRKSGKRMDGSQSIVLDSQCKACRRIQADEHRKRLRRERPEEYQRRSTARQKAYRERMRQRKRLLENEPDRQYPVGPFREWLIEYMRVTGLGVEQLAKGTNVDPAVLRRVVEEAAKKKVALSTVDEIGVAHGHISLTVELYPPEDDETGR